jgi:glycosyltransferase involved in cell wall biosynthesis|tara:strand:- start:43 stop:1134 length:1092 start_codon:yes stop_codon:yes gene_type:complete
MEITNKNKMRIHVIGCARNASTPHIAMDPYAMVSYYLTTYLHTAEHEVHYYGYKESTVECTKKWECGDSEFLSKYFVTNFEKNHWEDSQDGNHEFFTTAKEHLLSNCNDNDIVLCMWSSAIPFINDAIHSKFNNVKIVDAHIGHQHPSPLTPYHVFASNANKHVCHGKHDYHNTFWQDVTIYPMANDLNNFKYNKDKEDYFLFMGRLNVDKGLGIFIDLAKTMPNKNFKVAGQGHYPHAPLHNVEFLGLLDVPNRKKYLSNAKAVISPSFYPEPFGLTAIEAGLSGTPMISTDWGGYCETVIDGVTGFRCCYFNDFVNAVNSIETIKHKDCRKHAERFSAETLIKDWEKYLHKINRDDWYTLD